MSQTTRQDRDARAIAYQKPQPTGMVPDLLVPGAMQIPDQVDDHDPSWIAQADNVWFKPLVLSVSQGFYVNILWVRGAGVLSRHRHSGPVHAFTLRGAWHYLEHDWVAWAGDYAFEPPGETHTLVVPEPAEEMVTLFHVTGGYTYVDPQGKAMGYEDVFTKLDSVREHYRRIGRSPTDVDELIR
ncbi:2,4'-dihydroxyacetophenone dioxygenase family protein [Salinisphaera sp. SPP-AMP-43]|uniref:2,4'-dihydroxyacetophenone dioxygenase family protein n=1 Tax=Salinisphaera sp. SPP-AMP-43 TaxID=3121288 RepID=UPI003C6E7148